MVFLLIFLHQIFLSFCFYLQDLIKVVRLILAALSANRLKGGMIRNPRGITKLPLRQVVRFWGLNNNKTHSVVFSKEAPPRTYDTGTSGSFNC